MIFEYFKIVRLLSSLNIWFFVRILIRRNVEIYYLLESSEYLLDFDPNIFRYSIIYIRVFEYLPSSRYANIRMQPVPEFVLWRVFRLLRYSIAISSLFLIYIKYCMLHTHDRRKSRIWGTGLPRKSYLSIPSSWPRDKTPSLLSFLPLPPLYFNFLPNVSFTVLQRI